MKIFILTLIFIFLQISVMAQTPLPEWFRVDTSDDGIVELNTNYVMFSNRKIERVRFRWTYQTPQKLDSKSQVKYQSVLQEIQFDCQEKTFRTYAVQWFDAEGNLVASQSKKESEKMQEVKFGSIMGKLMPQACKLIELRKREPAVEQ
jgi:hypothetical protein